MLKLAEEVDCTILKDSSLLVEVMKVLELKGRVFSTV
jgi:hypothetical protein